MTEEKETLCKYLQENGKCDSCPMKLKGYYFFCEKNIEEFNKFNSV